MKFDWKYTFFSSKCCLPTGIHSVPSSKWWYCSLYHILTKMEDPISIIPITWTKHPIGSHLLLSRPKWHQEAILLILLNSRYQGQHGCIVICSKLLVQTIMKFYTCHNSMCIIPSCFCGIGKVQLRRHEKYTAIIVEQGFWSLECHHDNGN